MLKAKVTTVGNSIGIVLPKEVCERLQLKKGDSVTLVETEDGVRITPFDEEFNRTMEIADDLMRRYRNTLRELAK